MDEQEDNFITMHTAAVKLHCHPETLKRAKRKGLLETRQPGKKLVTTWRWLQEYLRNKAK